MKNAMEQTTRDNVTWLMSSDIVLNRRNRLPAPFTFDVVELLGNALAGSDDFRKRWLSLEFVSELRLCSSAVFKLCRLFLSWLLMKCRMSKQIMQYWFRAGKFPSESSPTESPGHNPETPGNNFQKSRTKSVLKIDWRHFKTLQMTQAHVAY